MFLLEHLKFIDVVTFISFGTENIYLKYCVFDGEKFYFV